MLDLNTFYSAIKVSGPDTDNFLQGQLTCDIRNITQQQAAYTAHCNQKGRMVCVCYAVRWADAVYLIMPKDIVVKTLKTLQRYIFRAKVELALADNLQIIGYLDGLPDWLEKPTEEFTVTQNEHACLVHIPGQRFLVISEQPQQHDGHPNKTIEDWLLRDIKNNMVWLTPDTIGQFIPNEVNLNAHGGVSLNKGCYIGQEIIARLHYLGQLKKQLYPLHIQAKNLPTAGTELLTADKRTAGQLVCCVQVDGEINGLAVLKTELAQTPLTLADGGKAWV